MSRNGYWQEINKQIGADLAIDLIPTSGYASKFQTTVTGNNIPDIVVLALNAPDQPKVLANVFAELTRRQRKGSRSPQLLRPLPTAARRHEYTASTCPRKDNRRLRRESDPGREW